MQKRRLWRRGTIALFAVLLAIAGFDATVQAQSSSNNFQMTEMEIGGSSSQESCSESYCSHVSIGDVGSTSTLSTAEFGTIDSTEPVLEVIIEAGSSNLGILNTQTTATKTSVVKIRNNLAGGGYVLQLRGDPPKFKNHILKTNVVPTMSTPGTEQFGINVAANTVPSVGTAPVQIPAGEQVFGVGADDYRTPNLFKYSSGSVVARGITETGRTDYTISMIINISSSTPAGHYSGDFEALVAPTY